jgi:hypothetical protein
LSSASSVNISQLRLAVQLQKFLERSARSGVRYTEFLRAHFSVAPRDERLDRPEYIGGTKQPVIFSEVLNTSGATTNNKPLGFMAGHGLSASRTRVCKYRVYEHGIIMGLLSVMPRTLYFQGVDRQWHRRSRYEYYFPEFAHLSEQAIYQEEIVQHESAAGVNMELFGYTGRYNEYRWARSTVHGDLRSPTKLGYWHLGRLFSTVPSQRPRLTGNFVRAFVRSDIYPVPGTPGMLINFANIISAVRPLPVIAEPGLMDHF